MAGSYRHCEVKGDEIDGEYEATGKFDADNFHGMIENGGDAFEACHMMFYMIQYLARLTMLDREQAIKAAESDYYAACRGEKNNKYWS